MHTTAAVGVESVSKPDLKRDLDAELVGSTARLPRGMWRELDELAEASKEGDPAGLGLSRNEVIIKLLRWAIDEMRAPTEERRPKPK